MKHFLTLFLLLPFAIGQKAEKEPIGIAELGGAASQDLKGGGSGFGYDLAVEVTPIEHWLELELGASPTYSAHAKEWDVALLFKKPWTFSSSVEFMFDAGPV